MNKHLKISAQRFGGTRIQETKNFKLIHGLWHCKKCKFTAEKFDSMIIHYQRKHKKKSGQQVSLLSYGATRGALK